MKRKGRKPLVLLDHVEPEPNSGCLIWRGSLTLGGYGWVRRNGRNRYVHRLAYEAANGPIPEGLTIDHLCRVRSCINVKHLEAVSRGINVMRGMAPPALNARKSHCPYGHEYSRQKLQDGALVRFCQACETLRQKLRRLRKRFRAMESVG